MCPKKATHAAADGGGMLDFALDFAGWIPTVAILAMNLLNLAELFWSSM